MNAPVFMVPEIRTGAASCGRNMGKCGICGIRRRLSHSVKTVVGETRIVGPDCFGRLTHALDLVNLIWNARDWMQQYVASNPGYENTRQFKRELVTKYMVVDQFNARFGSF